MTKASEAIDLLTELVANTQYEDGEMSKSSELSKVTNGLIRLKIYPTWIDWSQLLSFLWSELKRVKKIYNGIPSTQDQIKIAKTIHNDLISAPLKYIFYFELPYNLEMDKKININESISIKTISLNLISKIDKQNRFTYITKQPPQFSTISVSTSAINDNKPAPRFSKLKLDTPYLEVKATGFVSDQSVLTENIDPFHIYKLLVAFMTLRSILVYGGILQMLSSLGGRQYTHGNQASIYKSDFEFVTDSSRPTDEAIYIRKYTFVKGLSSSELENMLKDFKHLISPMSNEYLENERNKIINSLYWYFEGERMENKSFKTLMFVSMFDSFYERSNSRKETINSILDVCDYKTKAEREEYKLSLNTVYNDRNDIAHGNITLLEVARDSRWKPFASISPQDQIYKIYKKFINIKISKLLA